MPGRGTMVQISFHSNQEDKRSNTALSHFTSAVMRGCGNTLFPEGSPTMHLGVAPPCVLLFTYSASAI